ncbi:MAG TPA: ATP-binding protein [Planctomycetota bacterium]|nr:ATP-binding protein [Planctomycetota bacterium]
MSRLRRLADLMAKEVSFPIAADRDIVTLRQHVRELAVRLGFSSPDQISVVTAVSELAHNILDQASKGEMLLCAVKSKDGRKLGLQAVARDKGSGVHDPKTLSVHGPGPQGSPDYRLPTARRVVDEFEIVGVPGEGTTVTIRKWPR